MPEIMFHVEAIEIAPHSLTPMLEFKLRLADGAMDEPVAGIILHCQLMIDVPRRHHLEEERRHLVELFGDVPSPESPLRPLLWAHADVNVPAFEHECVVDMPVACSFDFNAAATKYFHALEEGEVPLCLQFSGTVFFRDAEGRLQVGLIPWSAEARCNLGVAIWRHLRDRYYPDMTWLCVQRTAFERLCDYKRTAGLPSWELALDRLLETTRTEPKT